MMPPTGLTWRVQTGDAEPPDLSSAEVVAAYLRGEIDDETHFWREGMSDWKRAHEIPELRAALSARGLTPKSPDAVPPLPSVPSLDSLMDDGPPTIDDFDDVTVALGEDESQELLQASLTPPPTAPVLPSAAHVPAPSELDGPPSENLALPLTLKRTEPLSSPLASPQASSPNAAAQLEWNVAPPSDGVRNTETPARQKQGATTLRWVALVAVLAAIGGGVGFFASGGAGSSDPPKDPAPVHATPKSGADGRPQIQMAKGLRQGAEPGASATTLAQQLSALAKARANDAAKGTPGPAKAGAPDTPKADKANAEKAKAKSAPATDKPAAKAPSTRAKPEPSQTDSNGDRGEATAPSVGSRQRTSGSLPSHSAPPAGELTAHPLPRDAGLPSAKGPGGAPSPRVTPAGGLDGVDGTGRAFLPPSEKKAAKPTQPPTGAAPKSPVEPAAKPSTAPKHPAPTARDKAPGTAKQNRANGAPKGPAPGVTDVERARVSDAAPEDATPSPDAPGDEASNTEPPDDAPEGKPAGGAVTTPKPPAGGAEAATPKAPSRGSDVTEGATEPTPVEQPDAQPAPPVKSTDPAPVDKTDAEPEAPVKPADPEPDQEAGEDPAPANEPKAPPPFDEALAQKALSRSVQNLDACRNPDAIRGGGFIRVTFSPDGVVRRALVGGALAGTPTGGCVARVFRSTKLDPFSGEAQTRVKKFRL